MIEGVAARQGIGGAPAVIDRIGISVVTPMNNEQECVEEFLRRTDAVLASMPGDHEIVIVDDGSTDRTPALLDAALTHMRRLRVVTLARNVGQCSALMAGLQASRGSTVVVMDGDLQNAPEDIPALVTHFTALLRVRSGQRMPHWSPESLSAFHGYRWPGNVRELQNIVERLAILHGGETVTAAHVTRVLPEAVMRVPATQIVLDRPLSDALDAYEKLLIAHAMVGADGNIAEAARRLQTDRPNLYRRMKRLGIETS